MNKIIASFCILVFGIFSSGVASAHEAHARYIANEGVLISSGDHKILFDPLPLSGFGTYAEISSGDLRSMMAGTAPFDGIDAVFISHAHRDHFSAAAMIAYMKAQPSVRLVAPSQALDMMKADPDWNAGFLFRMTVLDFDYGDVPQSINIGPISASAVRIAHAGWPAPARAKVQNMLYRVTLPGGVSVMHMGDADVRPRHYAPYKSHFAEAKTDLAMPPYWMFQYKEGEVILRDLLNVDRAVGIHVPLKVPPTLKSSGADFFSVPGETRVIKAKPAPAKTKNRANPK